MSPHLKSNKNSLNLKPRTKSRNGCLTCKKKRLKCDETKPSCLNCTKKDLNCGGYSINFKWKPFNDEKPKLDTGKLDKHLQLASVQVTGKTVEEISEENELIKNGLNPKSRASSFNGQDDTSSRLSLVRSYSESKSNSSLNSLAEAAVKIGDSPSFVSPVSPGLTRQIESSASFENNSNSPQHNKLVRQNEFDINLTPSLSAILNFAFNHDVMGDIPSVDTMSPLTILNDPQINQPSPAQQELEKTTVRFANTSKSSEHEQILKLYSEFTSAIMSIKNGVYENPWRNMILPMADNYSCLFNSIAAMTLFHLSGSNGILSSSTQELRSKGFTYMKRCIIELASGLSKMDNNDYSLPADIALATCLNLANCESWDTHTLSGIAHLKGAKSMINKILKILKDQQTLIRHNKIESTEKSIDPGCVKAEFQKKLVLINDYEYNEMYKNTLISDNGLQIPESIQFLFNQWIYFEVLAQMTTSDSFDDKGIDLVATITQMLQAKPEDTNNSSEVSDLSLDSRSNSINYFDPLLGCGQSLFSILGKVANLVRKIRITKNNNQTKKRTTLSIITIASELRQQLINWKPSITTDFLENDSAAESSWDLSSCISTAEAYRYSALLYLHQAVPEIPSLTSHTLAEKIFILLASIPTSSSLNIVHIFPLLVSSCEAEEGEEREWCELRWSALREKMWLGNIDRAFEVVKEVWKRKDEKCQNDQSNDNKIDSKTHWSSVMKEWGWEVLLG